MCAFALPWRARRRPRAGRGRALLWCTRSGRAPSGDDAAAPNLRGGESRVAAAQPRRARTLHGRDGASTSSCSRVAMRIPPWGAHARRLSADELKRHAALRTVENAFDGAFTRHPGRWTLPPLSSAAPDRGAGSKPPGPSARADGTPTLARRHPLTIEGDEIGSFEIVLGVRRDVRQPIRCATSKSAVRGDAGDRLSRVLLLSGKDRVTLMVQIVVGRRPQSRIGLPRGAMPSAPARHVGREGATTRSWVATETSAKVRTLIQGSATRASAQRCRNSPRPCKTVAISPPRRFPRPPLPAASSRSGPMASITGVEGEGMVEGVARLVVAPPARAPRLSAPFAVPPAGRRSPSGILRTPLAQRPQLARIGADDVCAP